MPVSGNFVMFLKRSSILADLDEVKSIIDESGNSFHCCVLNEFKTKGWHTLISPYYMDSISNKPREIDLVAEKAFKYEHLFNDKYGTINAKLFIECKYITQKVVFWFDEKNIKAAKDWVLTKTPLRENNVYFQKHSYFTQNKMVAKLFGSKTKPNQENEPIYKALNQSLNSMVYLRSKGSIIDIKPNRLNSVLESFSYPVIVCNSFDNFYRVNMTNQDSPQKIIENFQLEVNYAYIDKNNITRSEFFLIDVIDFNKLDDYLVIIDSDVDTIRNFM